MGIGVGMVEIMEGGRTVRQLEQFGQKSSIVIEAVVLFAED